MKKTFFFVSVLVCVSMLLSACGSGIIHYAPGTGPQRDYPGLQASPLNVYDTANLASLKPLREIANFELGIIVQAFQEPDNLQGALLVIPAGFGVAVSDGPQIGPADVVAVVIIATGTYYVCLYSAEYAAEAIGSISVAEYADLMQATNLEAIELYLKSHSNGDHNPNLKWSQARINIESFLAAMAAYAIGNGPDPRGKCGVTRDATGAIIRAAIWVVDSARQTGGYLMWYFVNTPGTPMKGPWGGSYDITSSNFDLDRNAQFERDRGWTWTSGVNCDSIPGGVPTFLQAAQP